MKINIDSEVIFVQYSEMFQKYYSDFILSNKPNLDTEKQDLCIKAIYNCFNIYFKYLNYKYNKTLNLPLSIIKYCHEKNYIKDINIFYTYFELFNAYFDIKNSHKKEEIKDLILKTFGKDTLEQLNNDILQNFSIVEYNNLKSNYENKNLNLENNNDSNFGLENFETYLLKYVFVSEPTIKTVYIVGSRANETFTNFSDINLVIDCPLNRMQNIIKKIQNLPIKYKITTIFIQNNKFSRLFNNLSLLNCKVFYTKEDKFPQLELTLNDCQDICKYLRTVSFKNYYSIFYKNLKKYKEYSPNYENQKEVLACLRRVQLRYSKYLSILLKENNIIETLPLKILYKCKELNIGYYIDWQIELTKKLRAYYDDSNTIETKFEIGENILFDYENFKKIQTKIDEIKYNICIKNFIRIYNYVKILNLIVNTDSAIYDSSIFNLSSFSYSTLLNYMKSNPKIKKAWISGSRALNCSRKGSDIDMLIECDLDEFTQIKKDLENFKIPESIDAQSSKDMNFKDFSIKNFIIGAKLFYDKSDFNMHWNCTKKTIPQYAFDISKII